MNNTYTFNTKPVNIPSTNSVKTLKEIIEIIKAEPENFTKFREHFVSALKQIKFDKADAISLSKKPDELWLKRKKEAADSMLTAIKKSFINDNQTWESYKLDLPWFLPTGKCGYSHSNKDLEWNGCLQLDFDFKWNDGDYDAEYLKKKLVTLPYMMFSMISPSGCGVKAIVKTNATEKKSYKIITEYVVGKIKRDLAYDFLPYDSIGISQPCFIGYDADVYLNEDAEEMDVLDAMLHNNFQAAYRRNNGVKPTFESLSSTSIIDLCLSIKNRYKELSGTLFIQRFVGLQLLNGIDIEDAVSFCWGVADQINYTDERETTHREMYDRYYDEETFGAFQIAKQYYHLWEPKEPKKNYILRKGQKLSDITIDEQSSFILVSPTGSGKTYWVSKQQSKKIICVPTTTLLKQVEYDYRATPFYEECKMVSADDKFIVVTYASLSTLLHSQKIKIDEYDLYIDEAHNISVSAAHDFCKDDMDFILDNASRFNRVVYMTATPCFIANKEYNALPVIKVTQEETIPKTYKRVLYGSNDSNNAQMKTALSMVQESFEKGNQVLVYLNNKSEKLEIFKELLRSTKLYNNALFVNAATKTENDFVRIVEGKDKAPEIVIATSLLKEGFSITEHRSIVDVYDLENSHPLELEQLSARFRKAEQINLYILKKRLVNYNFSFDFDVKYESIRCNASQIAAGIDIGCMNDSKEIKTMISGLNDVYDGVLKSQGNYVSVSDAGIGFNLHEAEKKYLSVNQKAFEEKLSGYGFIKADDLLDGDFFTEQEKVIVCQTSKESKDQKAASIKNIARMLTENNPIKGSLTDAQIFAISGDSAKTQTERDTWALISKLHAKTGWSRSEIAEIVETIDQKLILEQVDAQIHYNRGFDSTLSNYIDSIYKAFPLESKISEASVLNFYKENHKGMNIKTGKAAMMEIKKYLVFKRKTIRTGKNTGKETRVTSHYPLPLPLKVKKVEVDINNPFLNKYGRKKKIA